MKHLSRQFGCVISFINCIWWMRQKDHSLFHDNRATVIYSYNNRSLSKSKHIDIKFLVVKERVQSALVRSEHICANSILADLLTKALAPKVLWDILFVWVLLLKVIFKFNGSLYLSFLLIIFLYVMTFIFTFQFHFHSKHLTSMYLTLFKRTSWKKTCLDHIGM